MTVNTSIYPIALNWGARFIQQKTGVHENSLVLGKPEVGVQKLAFVYTTADQPPAYVSTATV